jgi:hypothetical protein
MTDDERVSQILHTDADALQHVSRLPRAAAFLWQTKMRLARRRRERAARLISLIEIVAAAIVVVGLLKQTTGATAAAAVLTAVTLGTMLGAACLWPSRGR